jgi:hypothetical protein
MFELPVVSNGGNCAATTIAGLAEAADADV